MKINEGSIGVDFVTGKMRRIVVEEIGLDGRETVCKGEVWRALWASCLFV